MTSTNFNNMIHSYTNISSQSNYDNRYTDYGRFSFPSHVQFRGLKKLLIYDKTNHIVQNDMDKNGICEYIFWEMYGEKFEGKITCHVIKYKKEDMVKGQYDDGWRHYIDYERDHQEKMPPYNEQYEKFREENKRKSIYRVYGIFLLFLFLYLLTGALFYDSA